MPDHKPANGKSGTAFSQVEVHRSALYQWEEYEIGDTGEEK
ncbi:MAG: hypothetical protein R8P61_04845 [Bacteroidia bacterium]|nr:hypothetical protein [Bacteroidia bacterium]